MRILLFLLVTLAVTSTARAQGSPAEWMKRILDPAAIGVTPATGTSLNRKLTVDYLSKENPPKQMAIYMAPLDQLKAVSDHFRRTLHVDPAVTGSGEFEIHRFQLKGGGAYPPQADGLVITITRSQFVDNKLQITMEYVPAAK